VAERTGKGVLTETFCMSVVAGERIHLIALSRVLAPRLSGILMEILRQNELTALALAKTNDAIVTAGTRYGDAVGLCASSRTNPEVGECYSRMGNRFLPYSWKFDVNRLLYLFVRTTTFWLFVFQAFFTRRKRLIACVALSCFVLLTDWSSRICLQCQS